MTEGEPKAKRITSLERVKELLTRPPKEERDKLEELGIHYVGTDEEFKTIQRMVAESGAILEGHFDLGLPEETTDSDV